MESVAPPWLRSPSPPPPSSPDRSSPAAAAGNRRGCRSSPGYSPLIALHIRQARPGAVASASDRQPGEAKCLDFSRFLTSSTARSRSPLTRSRIVTSPSAATIGLDAQHLHARRQHRLQIGHRRRPRKCLLPEQRVQKLRLRQHSPHSAAAASAPGSSCCCFPGAARILHARHIRAVALCLASARSGAADHSGNATSARITIQDAQPSDDRPHIDIRLAREIDSNLHQLANAPATPAASPSRILVSADSISAAPKSTIRAPVRPALAHLDCAAALGPARLPRNTGPRAPAACPQNTPAPRITLCAISSSRASPPPATPCVRCSSISSPV